MYRIIVNKVIKILVFFGCLWLFTLFSFSFVQAEVVSTHNEEQAAKQTAMDRLFDRGCLRTYMRRTGQFQVIIQSDSKIDIQGYTVTIECVVWGQGGSQPPPEDTPTVSWTPPTKREAGEDLLPQEIAGYNVYIDGVYAETVTTNAWAYSGSKLPIKLELTTIDTDGLESRRSEEVLIP